MGAGGLPDDFHQDEDFSLFVNSWLEKKKCELVINGDFIDFVQTPLPGQSPKRFSRLGNTEEESRAKLQQVIDGHPLVFEALRRLLDHKHRLVIVPGNHDVDLFWPGVREDLREHLGNPGEDLLYFERSGVYRTEGLWVEHGNQYFEDSFFGNFTHPFLRDRGGQLRLERCWGNCFLMYFAASMREKNPFVDNVKPVTSLVWMGIQEETFPFKIQHAYKLVNFILRVGFPPFKPTRREAGEKDPCAESYSSSRRRILERLMPRWMRRGGFGTRLALPVEAESESPEAADPVISDPVEGKEPAEPAPVQPAGPDVNAPISRKGRLVLDPLATREDVLSLKARELLLSEDDVDVVIFGHDHRYYSNELFPSLDGKKGKYYVNTGTWVPMLFLNRARKQLRWQDLRDQSLYTQLLTYAEVKRSFGRTVAELKAFDAKVGSA